MHLCPKALACRATAVQVGLVCISPEMIRAASHVPLPLSKPATPCKAWRLRAFRVTMHTLLLGQVLLLAFRAPLDSIAQPLRAPCVGLATKVLLLSIMEWASVAPWDCIALMHPISPKTLSQNQCEALGASFC